MMSCKYIDRIILLGILYTCLCGTACGLTMDGTVFTDVNDLVGSGMEGVLVTLVGSTNTQSITTDADGYWRFEDIDSGKYDIHFEKDGYEFYEYLEFLQKLFGPIEPMLVSVSGEDSKFAILALPASDDTFPGDGTLEVPYVIQSPDDLLKIEKRFDVYYELQLDGHADPNGRFVIDGDLDLSTNIFVSDPGDTVLALGGDLSFAHADEANIQLRNACVSFIGPGPQELEVGGLDVHVAIGDLGDDNFGFGRMIIGELDQSTAVFLVDAVDNGNRIEGGLEALYLFGKDGLDGLSILAGSTLYLNGLNVYVVIDGVMTSLNDYIGDAVAIPFDQGWISLGSGPSLEKPWHSSRNGGFERGVDPPTAENPVMNLSKEAPDIEGWWVTQGTLDWNHESVIVDAGPGQRFVDLSSETGQGAVTQVIHTMPGTLYHVWFDLGVDPHDNVANNDNTEVLEVSAAGSVEVFGLNASSHAASNLENNQRWEMCWQKKTWHFVAEDELTVLTFANGNPNSLYGPAIDNVVVCDPGQANLGNLVVQITDVDTSKCPSFEATVRVTNADQNSVMDLNEASFSMYENGIEQSIISFAPGSCSVAFSLVLDYSRSMGKEYKNAIPDMQEAALGFIGQMRSQDIGEVIKFSEEIQVMKAYTFDQAELIDAIKEEPPFDQVGTALYDALFRAVTDTSEQSGCRAVVVLTDGEDVASKKNKEEVIEYAQSAGIPIFAVGFKLTVTHERHLREIAEETGGLLYLTADAAKLNDIYLSIANTLNNQYTFTYETTGCGAYLETHQLGVMAVNYETWGYDEIEFQCPSLCVLNPPAVLAPLQIRMTPVSGVKESDGEYLAVPGSEIEYEICIKNTNDFTVTDISLVDMLPEELEFVKADSLDSNAIGVYDEYTHGHFYHHISLAPDSTRCFEVVARIRDDVVFGSVIANSVTVNSDETTQSSASVDVEIGQNKNTQGLTKSLYIAGNSDVEGHDMLWVYDVQPDGKLILQATSTFPDGGHGVNGLGVDPESDTLFITYRHHSDAGTMDSQSLAWKKSIYLVPWDMIAGGIAYDAERSRVYITDQGKDRLIIYNWLPELEALNSIWYGGSAIPLSRPNAGAITFDSDQGLVYVASKDGDVEVLKTAFDRGDWQQIGSIQLPYEAQTLSVDSRNQYLYAGGWTENGAIMTQHNLVTGASLDLIVAGTNETVLSLCVDSATSLVYALIGDIETDVRTIKVYTPGFDTVQTIGFTGDALQLHVPSTSVGYNPLNLTITPASGVVQNNGQYVAMPGAEIEYEICMTNTNEFPVTDILLTNSLPDALDYVRVQGLGDAMSVFDEQSRTYFYLSPVLNPGTTECFKIVARVNTNVEPGAVITNSIAADSNETAQSDSSVDVEIGHTHNTLGLTKTVVMDPNYLLIGNTIYMDAGGYVTYQTCLSNLANINAVTNVLLVDQLSPYVDFVSAEQAGQMSQYDASKHSYTWAFNSVEPNFLDCLGITVRIKDNVPPGQLISNEVLLSGSDTSTVTAKADIVVKYDALAVNVSIKNSGDYNPVTNQIMRGGVFTYVVDVNNLDPVYAAENVVVVDSVPDGLDFIMASVGDVHGVYNVLSRTYTLEQPYLGPGEGIHAELTFIVANDLAGNTVLTNQLIARVNGAPYSSSSVSVTVYEPKPAFVGTTLDLYYTTPLNQGHGDDIRVVMKFPDFINLADIDTSQPLIMTPGSSMAYFQDLVEGVSTIYYVTGLDGQVRVEGFFDRQRVVDALELDQETVNITVTGSFKTGQGFMGQALVSVNEALQDDSK